jgi:serine/threonine protein phosphatase PrpC
MSEYSKNDLPVQDLGLFVGAEMVNPESKDPELLEKLEIILDFIGHQLETNIDSELLDSGYTEDSEFIQKESKDVDYAGGVKLSCTYKKAIAGTDPNEISVRLNKPRYDFDALYFTSDKKVSFVRATHDNEHGEDDLSYAEVEHNEIFQGIVQDIHAVIAEQQPRTLPEYKHRELDSPLIVIGRPENPAGKVHDAGFDILAYNDHGGHDAVLFDNDRNIYGVFDGVGKGNRSDRASRLAAQAIQEYMSVKSFDKDPAIQVEVIRDAFEYANSTIKVWEDQGIEVGKTTAVVAKLVEYDGHPYLIWANAGDSRIYMINPEEKLIQLSKDDSPSHPEQRHVITNWLGGGSAGASDIGFHRLQRNTSIILATDGITGDYAEDVLSDSEIVRTANMAPTAKEAANNLVRISRKIDDKAVVVFRI